MLSLPNLDDAVTFGAEAYTGLREGNVGIKVMLFTKTCDETFSYACGA